MKTLGVFLAVTVAFASALPKTESESDSARKGKAAIVPFIVGDAAANVAPKNSIPYQLSLQVNGEHKCGAVIYKKNWALTAASCVAGIPASQITLVAGINSLTLPEASEQIREAKNIIDHWDYNAFRSYFNLALIELKTPFTLTSNVKSIDIYAGAQPPASPGKLTVSGWGLTGPTYDSTVLKVAQTDIKTEKDCKDVYDSLNKNLYTDIICCGAPGDDQDVCEGDYGGPLVQKGVGGAPDVLVGIASKGLDCAKGVKAPVLHTYLNQKTVLDWLKDIAK